MTFIYPANVDDVERNAPTVDGSDKSRMFCWVTSQGVVFGLEDFLKVVEPSMT